MSYHYIFKYVVVGDSGVGKSCLLKQFVDNQFVPNNGSTIGAQFGTRMVKVGSKKIKLQVWDTAGQEKFRSVTQSFYRGSAGALLVYDITNRQSFDHMDYWLKELKKHDAHNMTIMLIGNKSDLGRNRAVSTVEGSEFAQKHGLIFIECSAKTAKNVEEAFVRTAMAIHKGVQDGDVEVAEDRGIRVQHSSSSGLGDWSAFITCCNLQ